ncbi:17053_t:CDS:1, partial [Gigaspora rosea]
MNTEANNAVFNNIFRTEYAELILNNSSTSLTSSTSFTSSTSLISSTSLTSSASSISSTSPTNLKVPLNLTYTEQIAQKRRKANILTDRTDELAQYL